MSDTIYDRDYAIAMQHLVNTLSMRWRPTWPLVAANYHQECDLWLAAEMLQPSFRAVLPIHIVMRVLGCSSATVAGNPFSIIR